MTFDPNKPYRTRNGREAKILGTMPDGRLCGWIKNRDDTYSLEDWSSDGIWWATGTSPSARNADLVNVPETRTVKVGLQINADGTVVATFPVTRQLHDSTPRVAVAKIEREITFTVGEGLDP